MPCDAADVTVATLACTPLPVWRSWQFIGLALGDAVLIVIDVYAIAYAPKHVSGSECALIGLLENILAPLSVWKSTSELGYPEKYCVDLREPPSRRTASRRWRAAPKI